MWLAFANLEYQSVDMTWIAWYPWISDIFTHGTICGKCRSVCDLGKASASLHAVRRFSAPCRDRWNDGTVDLWDHHDLWPCGVLAERRSPPNLSRIPFREVLLGTVPPMKSLAASVTSAAASVVDGVSKAIRPAVLFVAAEANRRSLGFTYFWKRGFPCVANSGPERNSQSANRGSCRSHSLHRHRRK